MRHRRNCVRLGRKSAHRKALLASLVCNLIEQKQITTTHPKAKLARTFAEKMVTLGRAGTLTARRRAISELRQEKSVTKLFAEIVPQLAGRNGGYTRIVKLERRPSDSAEMSILEWVGIARPERKKVAKEVKEKTEAKASK